VVNKQSVLSTHQLISELFNKHRITNTAPLQYPMHRL